MNRSLLGKLVGKLGFSIPAVSADQAYQQAVEQYFNRDKQKGLKQIENLLRRQQYPVDAELQYILAYLYIDGQLTATDPNPEIQKLLYWAAHGGNNDAVYIIAYGYENALWGFPYDEEQMFAYYRLAAEEGHKYAQYRYGLLLRKNVEELRPIYHSRKTLEAQNELAFEMLARSAHQGYSLAIEMLSNFESKSKENQDVASSSGSHSSTLDRKDLEFLISSFSEMFTQITKNANTEQREFLLTALAQQGNDIKVYLANAVMTIINHINKIKQDNEEIIALHKKTLESVAVVEKSTHNISDAILAQKGLLPDVIAFFKEYETKIVVYAQDAPDTVRSNCESELEKIFGPDWRNEKRLSHTACERLLAAKILMHYSSQTHLEDYRGIIIAASSALEYELARRFFDLQLAYLRENGYREEEYPNCFHLDSSPNKPLGFTLGSLFSIIKTSEGNTKVNKTMTSFLWEKILSENAKRINSEKGFKNVGAVFINYNLDYPEASHAPISSTFSGKCTILAKDYRNKAAHKDIVDKSLADACCNMIGIGSNNIGYVDAASTLQHVQGLLKVLLLLTKPLDVEER